MSDEKLIIGQIKGGTFKVGQEIELENVIEADPTDPNHESNMAIYRATLEKHNS